MCVKRGSLETTKSCTIFFCGFSCIGMCREYMSKAGLDKSLALSTHWPRCSLADGRTTITNKLIRSMTEEHACMCTTLMKPCEIKYSTKQSYTVSCLINAVNFWLKTERKNTKPDSSQAQIIYFTCDAKKEISLLTFIQGTMCYMIIFILFP